MSTVSSVSRDLEIFLSEHMVATMPELQRLLQNRSRMGVFRALRELGYRSSYSHRGAYYALAEAPCFDERGLWQYADVHFSRHGNLLNTTRALVECSLMGFRAGELDLELAVETKHALLQLSREGKITREKIAGTYVYMSAASSTRREQRLLRIDYQAAAELGKGMEAELMPEELKAAVILFFSLLDEQQRRLYAGLEAAKYGHGGDQKLADLLGLSPHTVGKGRRQLFAGEVSREHIRLPGGGDIAQEKKSLV